MEQPKLRTATTKKNPYKPTAKRVRFGPLRNGLGPQQKPSLVLFLLCESQSRDDPFTPTDDLLGGMDALLASSLLASATRELVCVCTKQKVSSTCRNYSTRSNTEKCPTGAKQGRGKWRSVACLMLLLVVKKQAAKVVKLLRREVRTNKRRRRQSLIFLLSIPQSQSAKFGCQEFE